MLLEQISVMDCYIIHYYNVLLEQISTMDYYSALL